MAFLAPLAPALPFITAGASLVGGLQAKKSADRAASAARAAGEFNAEIIERDIDLLEKSRGIMNANFLVQAERASYLFEKTVQGGVRSGYGYGGIDMSIGTPIAVLQENAREFDFEQKNAAFDNSVRNMQIDDQQEGLRLSAELSRMEGGMAAASAQAQGTKSLINSISNVAQTVYENPKDFGIA